MGAGAFAAVAVIGQGLAFLQAAAAPTSVSGSTVARIGLLYFYAFHHVGIVISGPSNVSYTISVALLLVTAAAVMLLFLAGRWVADRSGGGVGSRFAHGVKVAVPYAACSLGLSYVDRFRFELPANTLLSGPVQVGPDHLQAFLWPFVIAAVAAGLGGVSTRWAELAAHEPWGRRGAVALRGGGRMFVYGLALAFAGLLVVAALKPEATRAYVRTTAADGLVGADALAHHVLVLPNQSMWVLTPAMGACDGSYGAGQSVDLLCYWRFPKSLGLPVTTQATSAPSEFATAPAPYFLFLLVPLVAVVAGGAWAGADGGGETMPEGALVGAFAGVVFAALVLAGAVLGGIGLSVSRIGSSTLGPNIFTGTAMAALWGVVGGAAGGAFAVRLKPRR